ncbi:glutamate receptor 1-like [Penaeus indicus]|uniref:glutamate receptor 1-like n=1 Tax=Penaeus indicus TaxID=29960 RepID=UPI00300C3504
MGFLPEETPCLKVAIEKWAPYVISISNEAPYQATGTAIDMMEILAKHLNICYEFVISKDRVFGSQLPNGTWTGLMGLLTRGEADMTAVILSMDSLRDRAVDFSVPLYVDQQAVGYKRPVYEADMLGFVKPYKYEMWLLLLTTMALVFGCTFVIQLFQSRGETNGECEETEIKTVKGAWGVLLWTFGALLAQSIPRMPKGNSGRFIGGLWLLSALIIGSVYRSNLKAMLILPKLRLPFDSIEELVETDIPTFVYEDSMLHQAIMTAAPGTSLYKLRKQALIRKDVMNVVNEASEGTYAAFFGKKGLESIIDAIYSRQGKCPLYLAKGTVFTTSLCLAFPKGSPLVKKFNPLAGYGPILRTNHVGIPVARFRLLAVTRIPEVQSRIYRLKESGILNHMYLHGLSNYTKCLQSGLVSSSKGLRPFELEDFYGVLCVYFGGMIFSVLVFLLELAVPLKYFSSNVCRRGKAERGDSGSSPPSLASD